MSYTIEKASIADIGHILPLLMAYRDFYKCTTVSEKEIGRFIEDRLQKNESDIWLAFIEEKAVGIAQAYACFTTLGLGKIYILNDLLVEKSQRQLGIGNALIKVVVNYAKQKNAKRVDLKTAHDNHQAKKLYERFGFIQDEKFDSYSLTL